MYVPLQRVSKMPKSGENCVIVFAREWHALTVILFEPNTVKARTKGI
jgi:hypothetical protein